MRIGSDNNIFSENCLIKKIRMKRKMCWSIFRVDILLIPINREKYQTIVYNKEQEAYRRKLDPYLI